MPPEDAAPPLPGWLRILPWGALAIALGISLLMGWLLATGSPQLFPLAVALAALFYAGKEGGIPLGVSLGANPFLVGGVLFLADAAVTFALFPPVLAGMRSVEGRGGFLGRMLASARRRAERQRGIVQRYGAAGLFVFLLVPFAFNGPLVGAVLGRLAGLTPMRSLCTVMAAMAATTVVWTSLFAYGFGELGLDPRLPILVSVTIAALVVGTSVWGAWRDRATAPHAAPPAP